MQAAVQEVMALNPVVVNVTVHLWSYISIEALQLCTVFEEYPICLTSSRSKRIYRGK